MRRRVIRIVGWVIRAKYTAGSITAVIRPDGHILLVSEKYRDRNRWGLPGGYWKVREDPALAATRELREEVGLTLQADDLLAVATYRQEKAWHLDSVFLHELSSISPVREGKEIREAKWFAPPELAGLNLTRETTIALNHVMAYLEGNPGVAPLFLRLMPPRP